MSRDVTIFLRSSQRYPQQEPEEMELTVHGKLYFRGGCFFVSYEESAMTGMEGTRTTLKVEPGRVEIIRTGKNHSRLCFQEGLRHESPYRTPTAFCSWPLSPIALHPGWDRTAALCPFAIRWSWTGSLPQKIICRSKCAPRHRGRINLEV